MLSKSKKPGDSENIWAVRGVNHEARSAAKMTANKMKESLGSWLSRVIIEAAQVDLRGDKKQIARQEDVFNALETLSNKLTQDVNDLRDELKQVKTEKKSWIKIVFNKSS